MKLTTGQILKLIRLYRSHEVLWNPKFRTYRRNDFRSKALHEISNDMRLPVDVVAQKLRALRVTYVAQKNKIKKSKESGKTTDPLCTPTVFWFHEMSFLDEAIASRKYRNESQIRKVKLQSCRRYNNDIKLSTSQIMQLIGLYRSHELLWNINCKAYRRNDLRVKALEEISNEMFLPVDVVTKKIRALRITYTAERKKMQQSKMSGSSEDQYSPQLVWFEKMRFLDDSIIARKYYDNSIQISEDLDSKVIIKKSKSKTSRGHELRKIKLTKSQILQIIGLYRSHELLWNINSAAHRRKDLRAKALEDISNKMNLPVDVVAQKIRALRNTYTLERKKIQVSKESGSAEGPYKPILFWFKKMSFLDDSIAIRRYCDNNSTQISEDSNFKNNISKVKSKSSRSHKVRDIIKLTKNQISRLIELYRSHELLWNMNSKAYRRNDLKEKALEEISNEMFLPVDIITKKIRALRNTYTLEKKKIQQLKGSGSSADSSYTPTLFWFQDMSFLDDTIAFRKHFDTSTQINEDTESKGNIDKRESSTLRNISLTKSQISRLIALYRSHELLWNINVKAYRRPDLKAKALEEISEEMCLPLELVKKKIHVLRNTYVIERKKFLQAKKSQALGEPFFGPSLSWFHEMSFLDNSIIKKNEKLWENSSQASEDSCNYEEYIDENDELNSSQCDETEHVELNTSQCDETEHVELNTSQYDESFADSRPSKRPRITNSSSFSETLEQLKNIYDKENEFTAFGRSVAAQLEELPEEDAYPLMGEIQNLLTQCKLKNLRNRTKSVQKPLSSPPENTWNEYSDCESVEKKTKVELEEEEEIIRSWCGESTRSENLDTESDDNGTTKEQNIVSSNSLSENTRFQKLESESIEEQTTKQNTTRSLSRSSEIKSDEERTETQQKKRIRKFWVKPHLIERLDYDVEGELLKDLFWQDGSDNSLSFMNVNQFEEILKLVQESLTKVDTCMRAAITARTKLAVTLRYLATGDSLTSLENLARVSKATIGKFVPDVLRAIYEALQSKYLKVPDTEEKWKKIADDFNYIWHFPHTLGALDGKHIRVKAPKSTNFQFYNFKGFFSVVLFALVDAHGRFILIDVGCNGRNSDSTIYQEGFLHSSLEKGNIIMPEPTELVLEQGNKIPYFFIGDDSFRLDKHIMTPYDTALELSVEQEIFNYRICRARMTLESAFGKLTDRFKIFNRSIEMPSAVNSIVMTCCVLHNYLTKPKTTPMPSDFEVESLPQTMSPIGEQYYNTFEEEEAWSVRDELSRYLMEDGDVDFQWQK